MDWILGGIILCLIAGWWFSVNKLADQLVTVSEKNASERRHLLDRIQAPATVVQSRLEAEEPAEVSYVGEVDRSAENEET